VELKLQIEGKERIIETDTFNEEQAQLFQESRTAEREHQRFLYMTHLTDDRRNFLLEKIVEIEDAKEDDKEET